MDLFIAGTSSRPFLYENLFSRGERQNKNVERTSAVRQTDRHEHLSCRRAPSQERQDSHNPQRGGQLILESFYYCRKNTFIPKLLPLLGGFLLDSGAFTFMQGKGEKVNWDSYTDEYADYINNYKVELFFELDIDSVVGLKEVERLRKRLEQRTGRQPIPVWHRARGIEYYNGMVKDYPYVAYGGLLTDGISKKQNEQLFPYFINKAHENGAKIHALGYTSCSNLRKYHFDSVDSTAWLYGNRGGYVYQFNPNELSFFKKINVPQGKRLNSVAVAKHNFNEWIKFQNYAYKYL